MKLFTIAVVEAGTADGLELSDEAMKSKAPRHILSFSTATGRI
jgi:hypothetical protein